MLPGLLNETDISAVLRKYIKRMPDTCGRYKFKTDRTEKIGYYFLVL